MLAGIRQKTMVNKAGKIEISAAELPYGTMVEVIVLVDLEEQIADSEPDETTYLLSTPANRQRLENALRELEERTNYIYVNPQEL